MADKFCTERIRYFFSSKTKKERPVKPLEIIGYKTLTPMSTKMIWEIQRVKKMRDRAIEKLEYPTCSLTARKKDIKKESNIKEEAAKEEEVKDEYHLYSKTRTVTEVGAELTSRFVNRVEENFSKGLEDEVDELSLYDFKWSFEDVDHSSDLVECDLMEDHLYLALACARFAYCINRHEIKKLKKETVNLEEKAKALDLSWRSRQFSEGYYLIKDYMAARGAHRKAFTLAVNKYFYYISEFILQDGVKVFDLVEVQKLG